MSHEKDAQQRIRGGQVAHELGWPGEEAGLLGAFGGLLDIVAAPLRTPRSSRILVDRYRAESNAAVRTAMMNAAHNALAREDDRQGSGSEQDRPAKRLSD